MTFTVVLASKCFAADRADEGTLVRVGAKMGSKVVGTCEALRAEVALEGSRVFLNASRVGRGRTRALWIGEIENIITIGNGRRRGTAGFSRWGGIARTRGRRSAVER
jgi:hypothetical protein